MNILIIGSGGRESAFAWKIKQSKQCDELYIAPGNAGTAVYGTNLSIGVTDFMGIKSAVLDHNISMVVVGPEAPLVEGIYDYFKQDPELKEIAVIGPSQTAAQLEGSKAFGKTFMAKRNIPTAAYLEITKDNLQEGLDHLDNSEGPYVLKADGLAAGKGVLIIEDRDKAKNELKEMLEGKFGEASSKVVIEAFLDGIEFSVFVLTDGKGYVIFPEAKDYKRIGEGDTGLNTGGMGAISPVPFYTPSLAKKVEEKIILPTLKGLREDQLSYHGFIFLGLIKVGEEPYVIEYNCRMGDPETEVVLPRIKNDFVELLKATNEGYLENINIEIEEKVATTVMLVSGGYPQGYEKNKIIHNLSAVDNSIVFHAGTTTNDQNQVVTNGGRVMAITSMADDRQTALSISNRNAALIQFDKKNYRKDIGFDL